MVSREPKDTPVEISFSSRNPDAISDRSFQDAALKAGLANAMNTRRSIEAGQGDFASSRDRVYSALLRAVESGKRRREETVGSK